MAKPVSIKTRILQASNLKELDAIMAVAREICELGSPSVNTRGRWERVYPA